MKNKGKKQSEEPAIFAIKKNKEGINFSRKEFLGTIGAIGAGLALNPMTAMAEKIMDSGDGLSKCIAHELAIETICFSPDSKILASGSGDNKIKIWSIPEGQLLKTLENHTSTVNSICFSPDGKMMLSGSSDNYIKIWSTKDWSIINTLDGKGYGVYSMAMSPDGKIFATGNQDSTVKLWSLPDGKLLKTFKGHTSIIKSLSFSPDGKMLVSGSTDDTTKLWSIPDGKLLKTLGEDQYSEILSVGFSPYGDYLVSASEYTMLIWSLPDLQLLKTMNGYSYSSVRSLSFSPDGNTIAIGSTGKVISLWSTANFEKIKEATFNNKNYSDYGVNSICYSPDGMILATGGEDKTIRIWHLPDLTPCYLLFDPSISEKTDVMQLKKMGADNLRVKCGEPIPSGMACVCDCVSGSRTYPGTELVCQCNTITVPVNTTFKDNTTCVCNTVSIGTYTPPNDGSYYGGGGGGGGSYWYPN